MMISKAVDEIARNFDLDFEALLKGFTVESACVPMNQDARKQHCTRLAAVLGHGSFFIGNSNLTVWDAKQQERQSACRVQPATAEDVSKVLQIILEEGCRFAVKGGGHAQFLDDSISVGGVTIDLQKMRSIEVSADRSLAKLGSGHILYSLYSGLEKHNLTTLGGRVADVGLGGYALGGGLSSLSPAYGLAMDNVFEYELVLPNATIVNVNQDSHPDLYFALRGGMSNFGIVTHFTMRAFPQGQVYGGSRTFPSQLRQEVLQQAFELTTQWKNDTAMAFYSHFTYRQNEDDFDITVHQEYARPTMDPPPFRQLNRLPSTSDNLRIDWTSSFSRESIFPSGYRNLFATATYQPSVDIDRKVQDILIEELQSCKAVPGLLPSIVTQPIYEEAIRANSDRGGSAAGLEAEGPLTGKLHLGFNAKKLAWNNEKDDATISALADRWLQRSLAIIQEAGKGNPWLYINYASKSQDPFASYGEKNRQRLIAIQKEVDPRGTFTSKGLCRGNFKLR
ncbi:FAD/FMN-binding dehydrogenase [Metarhizium robertsii]|uniref:FAD/FMN-binding dehydrogenase n=1 Tax=Metarhizium robertsii TaxID=568076 RepID=A0A014N7A9_9HYPO|nr:FAD/FMN-binding dehydrogenase [Metarhizium robertsii]